MAILIQNPLAFHLGSSIVALAVALWWRASSASSPGRQASASSRQKCPTFAPSIHTEMAFAS
jgi:hypothetical protein